jgi:hypothetical protein
MKRLWNHVTEEQRQKIVKTENPHKVEEMPLSVVMQLEYKHKEMKRVNMIFMMIFKRLGNEFLSALFAEFDRVDEFMSNKFYHSIRSTIRHKTFGMEEDTDGVFVEYLELHPAI